MRYASPRLTAVNPVAERPTWGELLHRMAVSRPHHPAVIAGDAALTFGGLEGRASDVARSLLALGVKRGDVVAVLDGNTAAWLEVFSGAAMIGAVCAPVNTWFQSREITEQLSHSCASVLLVVSHLLRHDYANDLQTILPTLADSDRRSLHEPLLPALRHVVAMPGGAPIRGAHNYDEFLKLGESVQDGELEQAKREVTPEDVLHILYTSGSTSRPKGVQVTHRGVIENSFQVGERLHLEPDDRFWHSGPLFYGLATVFTLPATWTHGATYLLQQTFKPQAALEFIERERATAYAGYGNVTRALLQDEAFGHLDLSSLTKGATGFTREDKRLAAVDLGVHDVCAMYGLTESHGPCAITEAGDPGGILLDSQGLLVPGWKADLRDPLTGGDAAPGEVGELLIRGQLMPGYLDDPQENAAAFTPDGWFRTGDLVLFGDDGRLRFQSRAKEVLKVGGINISPAEVENIIDEHPDVRQVHVVGLPDPSKGQILVAFVERGRTSLNEDELRSFVAERAAKFKVPSHVLFRAENQMPRVASGKMPRYLLVQEAMRELGLS